MAASPASTMERQSSPAESRQNTREERNDDS
jgi:hypothetical protein